MGVSLCSFDSIVPEKVPEAGVTVLQLWKESSDPGFNSAVMSGLGHEFVLSLVPLFPSI